MRDRLTYQRAMVCGIGCLMLIASGESACGAESMRLEQYVRMAESESLQVKSSQAAASSSEGSGAKVGLPAPMFGLNRIQDASGAAGGFEITQAVPFPGSLSSERETKKSEARARRLMAKYSAREVAALARLIYVKTWLAQERVSLLKEKARMIGEHLKLSRAVTRSDSFLKIHSIKAEGDLDSLEGDILQAEQTLRESRIRAAEFVNRSVTDFELIAEDVAPASAAAVKTGSLLLEVKNSELEASRFRETTAHRSWFPELNLRYREMGGTMLAPKYSEVMIGASLPFLYFWESRATTAEASGARQQAEFELQKTKREIEAQVMTLRTRIESLNVQLELYRNKLLPRAEQRMKLIRNVAPRDMETLQDHRETMEALPELKLKALELRAAHEEAVAELAKISGDEP